MFTEKKDLSTLFQEFSPAQRQVFEATVQASQAEAEAGRLVQPFRGGMHYKRIKGREYLYRYRDRLGHGESLGPRSPEHDHILAVFRRERQAALDQLKAAQQELKEQARLARALRLNRIPRVMAQVLRLLEADDRLAQDLMVVGTGALYAYEAAAGGIIEAGTASCLGLGPARRRRLSLLTQGHGMPGELLALCLRVDRTFEEFPGLSWMARNRRGIEVAVITPQAPFYQGMARPDNHAGEARSLAWLAASPQFSQAVLGEDGLPAAITAPDPRAFALHKLWLSQQMDRLPATRDQDLAQAVAAAALVVRYLPQYDFFAADLRKFPPEVHRGLLAETWEESEPAESIWRR
jgi:hypothetical protein